jgi:hypothetical protein
VTVAKRERAERMVARLATPPMVVALFDAEPGEVLPDARWVGPFSAVVFPSDEARDEARVALTEDGETWLDAGTFARRLSPKGGA